MLLTGIVTGLIVLIGIAVLLFTGFCMFRRYINTEKQGLADILRAYFESPDTNTPSQFALLVDSASQVLAKRVIDQAKGSFLGMQSGDSRLEKAMQADMMRDAAVSESPLLAGLMSMFPTLARRVSKNPVAMQLLPGLLSKIGKSRSRDNGGSGTKQLNFI